MGAPLSEVTLDGVPCVVEDFRQGRVDFGLVPQQKWWILASKECDLTNKSWLVGGLEHFLIFSIQLGISSSQLPNPLHHFSEG